MKKQIETKLNRDIDYLKDVLQQISTYEELKELKELKEEFYYCLAELKNEIEKI